MPNHVTTRLTIKADTATEIERFRLRHLATDDDGKRVINFDSILPMPKMLEDTAAFNNGTEQAAEAIAQTGHPSWYEWRVENWGTKWNAYHFTDDPYLVGDKEYCCSFDTAWSYPQAVFEKLHEMYPEIEMEVAFFDEGFIFAGHGAAHDPEYCDATDELHEEVYGMPPEREPELEQDPEFEFKSAPKVDLDVEPELE